MCLTLFPKIGSAHTLSLVLLVLTNSKLHSFSLVTVVVGWLLGESHLLRQVFEKDEWVYESRRQQAKLGVFHEYQSWHTLYGIELGHCYTVSDGPKGIVNHLVRLPLPSRRALIFFSLVLAFRSTSKTQEHIRRTGTKVDRC